MIDDQGLVYANPAKTELIGVVPNFPGTSPVVSLMLSFQPASKRLLGMWIQHQRMELQLLAQVPTTVPLKT